MSQAKAAERPYHHGDLRRALLAATAEAIEEAGPAALSLRDLARRAGVSHAAPAHHFRDKAGLLTAFATEGFELLAATLSRIWAETGSLHELGVGYVRFAVDHRAHFEVMFRPDLYHRDEPEVRAAGRRAREALRLGVAAHRAGGDEAERVGLAAWSIVHGFATLWLNGAFVAEEVGDDPETAARAVLRHVLWEPRDSDASPTPSATNSSESACPR